MKRLQLLAAVAVLLAVFLAWRFFSGERTITVDFEDAPLADVITAIERQGGVQMATNLDPEMPVSLKLTRAPVAEAIDVLAIRTEADWQNAYLFAPDPGTLRAAIEAFEQNDPDAPAWQSFSYRIPTPAGSSITVDPRREEWEVEWERGMPLSKLLSQGAQKTSAFFAVAPDWDPEVNGKPGSGRVPKVTKSLAAKVGGVSGQWFLLEGGEAPGERGGEERSAEQRPPDRPRPVFSRPRGGPEAGRREPTPEWVEERARNAIAQLPPEERKQAQEEFSQWRRMFAELRDLPPEERREKFRELMRSPQFQESMSERVAARDSKRSPEQRAQRYQRYIERKQQYKSGERP